MRLQLLDEGMCSVTPCDMHTCLSLNATWVQLTLCMWPWGWNVLFHNVFKCELSLNLHNMMGFNQLRVLCPLCAIFPMRKSSGAETRVLSRIVWTTFLFLCHPVNYIETATIYIRFHFPHPLKMSSASLKRNIFPGGECPIGPVVRTHAVLLSRTQVQFWLGN